MRHLLLDFDLYYRQSKPPRRQFQNQFQYERMLLQTDDHDIVAASIRGQSKQHYKYRYIRHVNTETQKYPLYQVAINNI
jgi:hypothetical protein